MGFTLFYPSYDFLCLFRLTIEYATALPCRVVGSAFKSMMPYLFLLDEDVFYCRYLVHLITEGGHDFCAHRVKGALLVYPDRFAVSVFLPPIIASNNPRSAIPKGGRKGIP